MGPTAPVVKWISQRSSEPLFRVRILAGAQAKRSASEAKNLSSLCQGVERRGMSLCDSESWQQADDVYRLCWETAVSLV